VRRSLEPALARTVARQLMAKDARALAATAGVGKLFGTRVA